MGLFIESYCNKVNYTKNIRHIYKFTSTTSFRKLGMILTTSLVIISVFNAAQGFLTTPLIDFSKTLFDVPDVEYSKPLDQFMEGEPLGDLKVTIHDMKEAANDLERLELKLQELTEEAEKIYAAEILTEDTVNKDDIFVFKGVHPNE